MEGPLRSVRSGGVWGRDRDIKGNNKKSKPSHSMDVWEGVAIGGGKVGEERLSTGGGGGDISAVGVQCEM